MPHPTSMLSRPHLIAAAIVLTVMAILVLSGIRPQSLIGPAILTAPIALSLTQLGACLAAYVSLEMREPFHVGDTLTILGLTGTVQHITPLAVQLHDTEGQSITVPTSRFMVEPFSVQRSRPCEKPLS